MKSIKQEPWSENMRCHSVRQVFTISGQESHDYDASLDYKGHDEEHHIG